MTDKLIDWLIDTKIKCKDRTSYRENVLDLVKTTPSSMFNCHLVSFLIVSVRPFAVLCCACVWRAIGLLEQSIQRNSGSDWWHTNSNHWRSSVIFQTPHSGTGRSNTFEILRRQSWPSITARQLGRFAPRGTQTSCSQTTTNDLRLLNGHDPWPIKLAAPTARWPLLSGSRITPSRPDCVCQSRGPRSHTHAAVHTVDIRRINCAHANRLGWTL